MRCAVALVALAGLALADASIAPPATLPSVCPQVEWPMSREPDRAAAERFRPLVGRETHPIQMTARHVLFSTFWERDKGASLVVDRAAGKVVWRGGEALAMVEDARGELDGVLTLEHSAPAFFGSDGKRRWRLPGAAGGDGAQALLDGDRLVVVLYEVLSCGTRLFALDHSSGAIAWRADVDQIMVGHSKYAHRATITLRGGDVVLSDVQSGGCSLQTFDRIDGRRRSSVKKQSW
jgi:hypothetical protein